MRPRWLRGRALAVVIVGLVASGCSDSSNSSPSSAPGSSITSDASGVTSSATPTTTSTQAAAPAGTTGSTEVTIAGQVRQVLDNGDFVINDGKVDYTVAMSSSTKVVDLNGAEASPDDIQVDGSAQVTGLLSGTTITAETVMVPTPRIDVPATT